MRRSAEDSRKIGGYTRGKYFCLVWLKYWQKRVKMSKRLNGQSRVEGQSIQFWKQFKKFPHFRSKTDIYYQLLYKLWTSFIKSFGPDFRASICNRASEAPGGEWAVIAEASKHHQDIRKNIRFWHKLKHKLNPSDIKPKFHKNQTIPSPQQLLINIKLH